MLPSKQNASFGHKSHWPPGRPLKPPKQTQSIMELLPTAEVLFGWHASLLLPPGHQKPAAHMRHIPVTDAVLQSPVPLLSGLIASVGLSAHFKDAEPNPPT
jgi:hypothetical protein